MKKVKTILKCCLFAIAAVVSIKANTAKAAFEAPYYNITTDGGEFDGIHYYLNGERIKNAFFCDGTYTYYLQWNGVPMKNRLTYHPDGKQVIYFDKWGHEVFDSFVHVKKNIEGNDVDDLCYFGTTGNLYVNVLTYNQEGTKLYYANPYGVMEQNSSFVIDGNAENVQLANGNTYGYANAEGSIVSFAQDETSLKECSVNPTQKHSWVTKDNGHICAFCGELDYVEGEEEVRECEGMPNYNILGKHFYCISFYGSEINQYRCAFCDDIMYASESYKNEYYFDKYVGYEGPVIFTDEDRYKEENVPAKENDCEFTSDGQHALHKDLLDFYCAICFRDTLEIQAKLYPKELGESVEKLKEKYPEGIPPYYSRHVELWEKQQQQ